MNTYTVEQTHRNVLVVKFPGVAAGWSQWIMLTGDRHHDNPQCRRDIEEAHLKLARERGALIIDVGDLFCAMQGKYDPRKMLGDIRPEDNGPDYLDRLVRHAAEFYEPYVDNFLVLAEGNHESKIQERCGTNLTSNLVHRLNSAGGNVYNGKFGGWVRFQFKVNKTANASKNLKYFHGAGGGGPVTKGTIQSNRQAVYLPDADVVVNGHTHDAWVLPIARERLNNGGTVGRDIQWHVRTPGYKDDYDDGAEGWRVEKWGPPKPMGCIWLRFETGVIQKKQIRIVAEKLIE